MLLGFLPDEMKWGVNVVSEPPNPTGEPSTYKFQRTFSMSELRQDILLSIKIQFVKFIIILYLESLDLAHFYVNWSPDQNQLFATCARISGCAIVLSVMLEYTKILELSAIKLETIATCFSKVTWRNNTHLP